MRVKIINKSSRPDEVIVPLIEYAASFFPHRPGIVTMTIRDCKKRYGREWRQTHGHCCGSHCTVYIETYDNGPYPGRVQYPLTYLKMHYFRHANQDGVKPATFYDWKEYFLDTVAHELEHTTAGNNRMRRSRQEIAAWNRGVEVVEASRSPEAQALIKARGDEIVRQGQHKQDRAAFKKSAEYKRQQVETLMEKWQRKLKLAQTKIRKLKVRARYFDKKIAAKPPQKEV